MDMYALGKFLQAKELRQLTSGAATRISAARLAGNTLRKHETKIPVNDWVFASASRHLLLVELLIQLEFVL